MANYTQNSFRVYTRWVLISLLLTPLIAQADQLSLQWSVEQMLSSPESAAYDPHSKTIYVSNVNGYAKDGNGFISRFSADGSEQEIEWLRGLDSPTGMVVRDGKLYFADYDRLVVVDIATAEVLADYPAPDERPSLNDVALSPTGQIFVSGSSSNAIYSVEDGKLRVWMQDDILLAQANGLYVRENVLVHGGAKWSEFDIQSKKLLVSNLETEDFRNFDGITDDGCGGYLVTLIDDDRIWHMSADRHISPMNEEPIDGIDLQNYGNTLYIPRVGDGFAKYALSPDYCRENED